MTRVHLFQRYSGKENVVTNNTLLLLRRLYSASPAHLEGVLSGLFEADVSVGVDLEQQTRSGDSVPDGRLTQRGLEVVIETKVDAGLYAEQLQRHLGAFESEVGSQKQQFLLALTIQSCTREFLETLGNEVAAFNRGAGTQIQAEAITFQDLVGVVRENIPEPDYELQEVIDDFEEFCVEMNLLPRAEYRLRAVPCGRSFEENLKCGVYYEPAERSRRNHRYLGLYTQKAVRAIGEVTKEIVASIEDGQVITADGAKLSKSEEARIHDVASLALERRGWNVSGSRFTIVDSFVETEFTKDSKGGMRGTQYFDLGQLLGTDDLGTPEHLAAELWRRSWE